nr:serine/threonine/dual specificity protein kinase, catalytic domain-containing protein [Tanacetum cinerariifolium]
MAGSGLVLLDFSPILWFNQPYHGFLVDVKQKFIEDKVRREKVFVVNEAIDIGNSRESSFQVRGIHVDQTKVNAVRDGLHLRYCPGQETSMFTEALKLVSRFHDHLEMAALHDIRVQAIETYGDNKYLGNKYNTTTGTSEFCHCGDMPALDFTLDEQQHNLAGWAKHCIKEGKISQIIDPCFRRQVSANCLKEFGQIPYECLLTSSKDRPTMTNVFSRLEFVLQSANDQKRNGRTTFIEKGTIVALD